MGRKLAASAGHHRKRAHAEGVHRPDRHNGSFPIDETIYMVRMGDNNFVTTVSLKECRLDFPQAIGSSGKHPFVMCRHRSDETKQWSRKVLNRRTSEELEQWDVPEFTREGPVSRQYDARHEAPRLVVES